MSVWVDGSPVTFSWLSGSTIELDAAPSLNSTIHVRRDTQRGARYVNFNDGSELNAATLNNDSKQLFYLMQESYDLIESGAEDITYYDREAILNLISGWVDSSVLSSDLTSSLIGPINQILADLLFSEGDVYEEGTYSTSLIADRVTAAEILIDENAATISLMATQASVDGLAADVTQAQLDINGAEAAITALVADIQINGDAIQYNAAELALLANEFYVKLDANGYVSGFGLYNGGGESEFVVNADKFAFIKADGTGAAYKPFVVDSSSGLIGMDGSLIVRGSISAGTLAAGAVIAGNIDTNAVTANEIDVANLSAISANLGTITSGEIGAAGQITLSHNYSTGASILFDGVLGDVLLGIDPTYSAMFMHPVSTGMGLFLGGPSTYSKLNFSSIYAYSDNIVKVQSGVPGTASTTLDMSNSSLSLEAEYLGNSSKVYVSAYSGGGYFAPSADNFTLCGNAGHRWVAVYAVNGTIQTSDERDKEAVSDLSLGLDFINKLRPVNYSWLGSSEVRQGLIAQEVGEAAGPHPLSALDYDADRDRYGLNYAEFVVPLIKAVQELSAKVDSLL